MPRHTPHPRPTPSLPEGPGKQKGPRRFAPELMSRQNLLRGMCRSGALTHPKVHASLMTTVPSRRRRVVQNRPLSPSPWDATLSQRSSFNLLYLGVS